VKKEPKSFLGQLQYKFHNSGLNGNPVISNGELCILSNQLEELALYMKDRGDSSMAYCLLMEHESVYRMLENRNY
jgi:hypothetical protein